MGSGVYELCVHVLDGRNFPEPSAAFRILACFCDEYRTTVRGVCRTPPRPWMCAGVASGRAASSQRLAHALVGWAVRITGAEVRCARVQSISEPSSSPVWSEKLEWQLEAPALRRVMATGLSQVKLNGEPQPGPHACMPFPELHPCPQHALQRQRSVAAYVPVLHAPPYNSTTPGLPLSPLAPHPA
jgi:hypothetical protein